MDTQFLRYWSMCDCSEYLCSLALVWYLGVDTTDEDLDLTIGKVEFISSVISEQ